MDNPSRTPRQRQRGSLRPIRTVLEQYLTELGAPAVETRTAEARLRVGVAKAIKHDRLWSLGARGEQLTLDLGDRKAA